MMGIFFTDKVMNNGFFENLNGSECLAVFND